MPRMQDQTYYIDDVNVCDIHGEHQYAICPECHFENTVRIETESAELRYARTPDFMRKQRAELLASTNGRDV